MNPDGEFTSAVLMPICSFSVSVMAAGGKTKPGWGETGRKRIRVSDADAYIRSGSEEREMKVKYDGRPKTENIIT